MHACIWGDCNVSNHIFFILKKGCPEVLNISFQDRQLSRGSSSRPAAPDQQLLLAPKKELLVLVQTFQVYLKFPLLKGGDVQYLRNGAKYINGYHPFFKVKNIIGYVAVTSDASMKVCCHYNQDQQLSRGSSTRRSFWSKGGDIQCLQNINTMFFLVKNNFKYRYYPCIGIKERYLVNRK